ncbi:MAG: beta-galactosidase GalA [bacterium]|nr:beta-galactosidase GalA [bacterium]
MKHYNRQPGVYCLNKGWKFTEQNISVLPPTKNHDDVYGFSKGGAAKGPADASFDDSDWELVELPHDWVTSHDFTEDGSPNQGYKERGVAWYRMQFPLSEEDKGKQIELEFEGMSCDAEIYINGTILKRSFSGYNGFTIDMTDMANFGVIPNTIAINIDATAWEGWWYEGAGIYRNIWLVKKAPIHISTDGVFVKPLKQEGTSWATNVDVELENSFEFDKEATVSVELSNPEGQVQGSAVMNCTVKGFATQSLHTVIQIEDPTLWSPEKPTLYTVKVTVSYDGEEQDYLVTPIGYRTILLEPEQGFWLNGENIKLKGFCNHQDHSGIGVAVPYSIKEHRIKLLKELGANAYRLAHNPDPEILDICDRLGMMVMEENRTFSSAEDNLQEVKGIVKRARNHPSVVLYSVLNEEPLQGSGKGRRMAGRLQATIKSLDDTRPVLGALNGGYMEEEGATTILDAVGINYNPARYDDFHTKFPNIPLIGSETASAFMVRGVYETDYDKHLINCYDDEAALWGNTIKEAWKCVKERPFVAGTFVWTGFDYRGEPTPFVWPSVATFFGTYDSCGFEKDACYFYKAFWRPEPIVHLVSPWVERQEQGKSIRVLVITNCEEVELFCNGVSLGKKAADEYEQVEFTVPYEDGELKAVGYRDGIVVATDIQLTAKQPVKLQLTPSQKSLQSGGYEAVAIDVVLLDEQGMVIPNTSQKVQFEIKHGVLLGVGNGDPNSHESDIAPERTLFHGKAQAIVKGMNEEAITVTVTCEGVAPATITIPVTPCESIPYIMPTEEVVVDGWKLYYKTFDEMPDPNPKVDANDMNSFEPVNFTGLPQAELAGKLDQYGLYRTKFDFGKAEPNRYLYFSDVKGHVWIYLDGVEMEHRTDAFGGYMVVDLPEELSGDHILSVIILNSNVEWPQAGICAPVVMGMK